MEQYKSYSGSTLIEFGEGRCQAFVKSNPVFATNSFITESKQLLAVNTVAGWSSLVARRAHNPKVVGSNPAPATNSFIAESKQLLAVNTVAGWSSLVARRAHNPKVVGSNPAPATNSFITESKQLFAIKQLRDGAFW